MTCARCPFLPIFAFYPGVSVFADPLGGFQIEENTWQELTFGIRRAGKTKFELWVSANGISHNQTHTRSSKDGDWIPQQVDSTGIIYPNERGYDHVSLKT